VVRGPILEGRPALALGEPSVVWLSDYARGHIAGLRALAPDEAERQSRVLQAFDGWIRNHYRGYAAPWWVQIRVFEGAYVEGLKRFVELWDEFEQN
jgi:hypothetical protein